MIQANNQNQFLTRAEAPEMIIQYFQRAWNRGRIAHAYLFTGPSGSGKRQFAFTLAKAIFCETGEPCGTCAPCRTIENGNHPLFDIYGSTDQKSAINIETVREITRKDHRRHTDTRISIIEDCERFSPAVANALLKTLEEPQAGTLLILIAPSTGSLLPTLVSRCQRIQFPGKGELSEIEMESSSDETTDKISFDEAFKPDFFANNDPRAWLTSLVPDASSTREAMTRLLDFRINELRNFWKTYETAATPGEDPLENLEELIALRRDLDGNINVDLVLETFLRQLRRFSG